MGSTENHQDVPVHDFIVIGAGIAGINAGYLLKTEMPNSGYVILENRDRVGGTWDFWKYPGIRSDSFLALFGLTWHRWPHDMDFAEAHLIRDYLEDATRVHGIDKNIRLKHQVKRADWSSEEQLWTVTVDPAGGPEMRMKSRYILACTGYYDYNNPLPVDIPGLDRFEGEVVHPQFWTPDIQVQNKKIVLIGSGATAVTLFPNLAKTAKHITMLQRSPSYVVSAPSRDKLSLFLLRWLPTSLALSLNWYRAWFFETLHVWLMKHFPRWGKKQVMDSMRKLLPLRVDVNVHFNPKYNPYDQRLCLCPDADFFKAFQNPNADIVTDHIHKVTEKGIHLKSGQYLEADMIITATGLGILFLGGIPTFVDGKQINERIGQQYLWNGIMLEGVPNLSLSATYTEATVTPGTWIRTRQMLKLVKHAQKIGATSVVPDVNPEIRATMPQAPVAKISSTYIVTAKQKMPLSGDRSPWRNPRNYWEDWNILKFSRPDNGIKYTI
ncbi:hypothetical protein BKA56DRAFT_606900 [Ilyonectria sp. MPI-CAGE-AT-0026]|nr:hypothetical protein BKA56DRAFT_606900 [Ilyonectria sp. MPI-CAGE-AT-0026]